MGWTINFKSRAGKTCTVAIGGGGTTIQAASDPVSWEEDNSDSLIDVLRHHSGNINLIEDSFGDIDSLHPAHSIDLPVVVSYGGTAVFKGFVQAQAFSSPFAPGPHVVTIPIVSPLGVAGERRLAVRLVGADYVGVKEIPTTGYTAIQNYMDSSGVWQTATASDYGQFVPITGSTRYHITTQHAGRVAFVKSTTNIGGAHADFATGAGVVEMSQNTEQLLTAPSDATYLYVATAINGTTCVTRLRSTPISITGTETIGSVMKEICTALGFDYVVFPSTLLTNGQHPMHVKVSQRILCPYNSEYNYGKNDLFDPITYDTFLRGVCNLYGLIAHDSVDSGGHSVLVLARMDYNNTYYKMDVADLDDTSETGDEIQQTPAELWDDYDTSDSKGYVSYIRPLGRLDVDSGDKADDVEMEDPVLGTFPNVSRITTEYAAPVPMAIADGGAWTSEFYDPDKPASQSQWVQNIGNIVAPLVTKDGFEINICWRGPWNPITDTPLFEYIFSDWPRTERFNLNMRTKNHLYTYRVQMQSGSKFVKIAGSSYAWGDDPEYIPLTANDDNEYVITGIPRTLEPVVVRIYPRETQSAIGPEGMTFEGDPVTSLALTVFETAADRAVVNLDDPVRILRQPGEDASSSVSCFLQDYIDNSNRIIGTNTLGTQVIAQNNYAYMFKSKKLLSVLAKKITAGFDLSELYTGDFTVGETENWRVLSVGFDPWNDNISLAVVKLPPAAVIRTVTFDLDNVTTDAPSVVYDGESYTAVLTGESGNYVQANSVVVTMGGNDITSTSYNHATKTITIASVTGDVSITAVGKPYEAEVTYLQTDGTAYINTGITAKNTINIDIDFYVPANVNTFIFGGRNGYKSKHLALCIINDGENDWLRWDWGGNIAETHDHLAAGDYNAKNSGRVLTFANKTFTAASSTFTSSYTIYLFALNNAGTPKTDSMVSGIKIYGCKMYTSSTLSRDFIPVRIGQVGYLYDKVSGTFYGNNAASGSFTYGPDKT